MKHQILVVDGDASCRDSLREGLQASDFDVSVLYDAVKIINRIGVERPSLVIAASGPLTSGGFAALQALRSNNDDLPVIILGEQDDTIERVFALECGADDFILKPFNIDEVVVRVGNVLKRVACRKFQDPVRRAPYLFDGFTFDFLTRTLTFHDRPVPLTESEYALLNLLVSAPDTLFTREYISAHIASMAQGLNVRVWVHRLRARIRNASGTCDQINTVRGKGYAFSPTTVEIMRRSPSVNKGSFENFPERCVFFERSARSH